MNRLELNHWICNHTLLQTNVPTFTRFLYFNKTRTLQSLFITNLHHGKLVPKDARLARDVCLCGKHPVEFFLSI